MNEIAPLPIAKDLVKAVAQKDQEAKQLKHINTIRPHNGHTLYEVNLTTKTIVPATFEKEEQIDFEKAKKKLAYTRKKVITKPDCIYISALNVKNVLKRLNRMAGKLQNK